MMAGFLTWAEAYEAGPSVCGGKGYNLARLARYGFRVPQGGVLPVGAPPSSIAEGLDRLGLADEAVAVRSSAAMEDSARASFAGIHRSFLNVRGVAAAVQAAQQCIASLQSLEAVQYRRRMGVADDEAQCAVVICKMVPARCAGVAFTADPATGRRDLILIDAAEGLGEAVVGGRVNPARMVWRSYHGRLVRESSGAPLPWFPADAEEETAHQAWRVQWTLGEGQDPQDVEWAYDGRLLWVLQARPITRLPRPGWPETSSMPRYWSTANLKDNQPGISSELSWSTLEGAVGDAAYAAMGAAGYQMPRGMQVVRRFHGRGFFDLTMMQWGFYDAFGLMPAEVIKVIGGRQPEITVPPNPFRGGAGLRRIIASVRLLRQIWNHPRKAQASIERHLDHQRSLESVDWSRCSFAELYAALLRIGQAQEAFIPVFGVANSSYGPWKLALESLAGDEDLIARLQAGSGAVASAEHGYRLYEIARGESTIEAFLRDFGHRAIFETDAANPRWIEDPSWVVEQVEAIRRNPPARDPRDAAAEVLREAERETRRRFRWRAPLLLWMGRKLREAMASRENAKSALVSMILPVRRIVLEAGRRLAAAGSIDAPEQMTCLAHADVTCLLRGYWTGAGARELIADRLSRRERWISEPCPDVIVEEPDGRMAAAPPPSPPDGKFWTGIAISSGIASGPARIVRTPADAAHLQQGDVLIAPSTDPGWTPLFLRASAVVMETGGYLSHGAIVAREYGIPAVANVPGIIDALPDGALVTVDGSTGRVVPENNGR